jgi:hypothetical protein
MVVETKFYLQIRYTKKKCLKERFTDYHKSVFNGANFCFEIQKAGRFGVDYEFLAEFI